jgi:nucleolar protein 56
VTDTNREWTLAERPTGEPDLDCFELRESSVPDPGPGELLVRTRFLSVDPYMRGRMRDAGIDGARAVAAREPETELERRAVSLAECVADLAAERDALAETIDRIAPAVAPNLAEMAGPELAARLIALTGGLESLAKKPSGTVQVLGAEDALFAHLSGRAPSPKHGIIYTHDYVRNTRPEDRGSAARALAGKLTLAARVDHYAGERRETLHEELRERMATIRGRAQNETGGDADDTTEGDA